MSRQKHLFVFTPGLFAATSVEELEATEAGLKEVDLYHMPYERDVYIQVSAFEVIGPEVNDLRDQVIYGPFGKGQSVGISVYYAKFDRTSEWLPFDDPAITDLERMLIVVLATRNAEKHVAVNKLAKLGIAKGRRPYATTTTVSLPNTLETDSEHPPRGGSKAPHLRRGHVRRQHYGKGGQLEKKVWIAPVFVNADPDYVATRTRYRISGALHFHDGQQGAEK